MAFEYKVKDIKELAAHLSTMGAYVQQPKPQIIGLDRRTVVGSQDAKSLYPTIMALLNIGYDTLRGRIYDYSIVGKTLSIIQKVFDLKSQRDDAVEIGTNNFKNALQNMVKDYTNREKIKHSKKDYIEFTVDFYGECFRKIVLYNGTINNIFNPTTDEEYYLLKSALYPLFEALTWISPKNKGYSQIIIDHVFYNSTFDKKYKDEKFIIFHEINSVKTNVKILNLQQFKDQITSQYLLNPYGTYFNKHDDNKSFEVDLILGGMDDRAYVKNQMLIIGAIVQNWNKLSQIQQSAFILDNEKLDESVAKEVIALVGDSNPKVAEWQLNNLKGVVFETVVTEEKLKARLALAATQRNSRSNGIKTSLNSSYGIYGMGTWNYGNNLIANSITTGGKIYGIKLFQQIASNRLAYERDKIQRGDYEGQFK